MSTMKRHIGKIVNTDRRCVVVYMQIPGLETHALIVDTDALRDRFHDELMEIVEGPAQNELVLGNILSRRISSATGQDILTSLHNNGLLMRMPVENIVMLPMPNHAVPLTKIIELTTGAAAKTANPVEAPVDGDRFDRIRENQTIDKEEKLAGVAAGLLVEANMLADEAARKREQAYNMAPSLRPRKAPAAPTAPAAAPVAPVAEATPAKRSVGRPRKTPAA